MRKRVFLSLLSCGMKLSVNLVHATNGTKMGEKVSPWFHKFQFVLYVLQLVFIMAIL